MGEISYCFFINYGSYLIDLQPYTTYRLNFVRLGECQATSASVINIPGKAVTNIHIRNDTTSGTVQYSLNAESINAGAGGFLAAGKEREIVNDTANLKSVNIRPQAVVSTVSVEVIV